MKEIAALQVLHSQLKLKLTKLNQELNTILEKDYPKIKKKIIEKVGIPLKTDLENQKGTKIPKNETLKK